MFQAIAVVFIGIALFSLIPSLPDHFSAVGWTPPPPPAFEGPFQRNGWLGTDDVTVVYQGPVGELGVEDVDFDTKGFFYTTSVSTGTVLRIPLDGSMPPTVIARIPGIPLALKINPVDPSELIVCDSELGLVSVNISTGATRILASHDATGKRFRFVDHLDISRDGKHIYFSDASKYPFHQFMLDAWEGRPSGSIYACNRQRDGSCQVSLLAENLYFPNGVALSVDEAFVYFGETVRHRVSRINLKDVKKGPEIVFENLPGSPDNLHSNRKGQIWVSLVSPRSPLERYVFPYSFMRNLVARLPSKYISMGESVQVFSFNEKTSEITRYLEDPEGKFIAASTMAREHNGYLYVASLFQNRMIRKKL